MIRNFGYQMRYNKLTRPTAAVDNRVMEVQFHDMLVNSGVMRGRQIEVDADYDRGFLLVGSGIGKDIDAGFDWLHEQGDKYRELYELLRKQLDRRTIRYLLESIKAREAIPLVKKYLSQGKKVVLFHQAMREKENVEPFRLNMQKLPAENRDKILAQWKLFQRERPRINQTQSAEFAFTNGKFPKRFWRQRALH